MALTSCSAPSGYSAWRRLLSGITRPVASHLARRRAAYSSEKSMARPVAAQMASRVRSSGVGPIPPVNTTASARPMAVEIDWASLDRLSPTTTWK